jgi:hypothetical protein
MTVTPVYGKTGGEVPATPDDHERPCACYGGWVFITYEDEHGEEREASYRCRRCADEL